MFEEAKKKLRCPICNKQGKMNSEGELVCRCCGYNVPKKMPKPYNKYCGKCGSVIAYLHNDGSAKCRKCGNIKVDEIMTWYQKQAKVNEEKIAQLTPFKDLNKE